MHYILNDLISDLINGVYDNCADGNDYRDILKIEDKILNPDEGIYFGVYIVFDNGSVILFDLKLYEDREKAENRVKELTQRETKVKIDFTEEDENALIAQPEHHFEVRRCVVHEVKLEDYK